MKQSVITNQKSRRPVWVPLLILWAATVAGQMSHLAYVMSQVDHPFLAIAPYNILLVTILTIPAVALGLLLGKNIGLGAPTLVAIVRGEPGWLRKVLSDARIALFWGLALGLFLLGLRYGTRAYLPPELPALGHRGLLGGLLASISAAVGEEVWFRLGLMTLLFWIACRLRRSNEIVPVMAWALIILVAGLYGLAHLPQLTAYGATSPIAIGSTIIGNILAGSLYGWFYWQRGLFAAIVTHFSVDVVLHVLPAI